MDYSQSFIKALNTVTKQDCKNVLSKWHANFGLFTEYMLDSDNSFLRLVANELNLKCYTNGRMGYYFIDAVFYKPEDQITTYSPSETWLKNIRIAIEHENQFDHKLYQEVSRLLIIKCDLRVLISYYDRKDDDYYNQITNGLYQIIKSIPDSENIAKSKSFLFIIGAGTTQRPSWEAKIFGNDGWVTLQSLS